MYPRLLKGSALLFVISLNNASSLCTIHGISHSICLDHGAQQLQRRCLFTLQVLMQSIILKIVVFVSLTHTHTHTRQQH